MCEKNAQNLIFAIEIFQRLVFSVRPERRFGGIGRRARLKIEYLRVWVRVPQPLLFGTNTILLGIVFFFIHPRARLSRLLLRASGFAG